ncbi:hypothetical protein LOTGIDRAFT_156723 [Lottia gigantea]|uniref:TauD/TfdA-like domain-containing protein n=1 Tax=Lottia gigantea TaxID=225164 RepID=V4BA59_LOTGI|nr:hypothetical protein LOTGIDRAFT_156723 [Lottia gigantea]ESP02777.1 hypothetical protein LOTGIDRAFT_156723 [Lottia gigantea]
MAQVPIFPKVLFFYCDVPPSEGRQTPLVISNEIYRAINERHPEFFHDLEEKGVKYTRVLPDGDNPTSSESGSGREMSISGDSSSQKLLVCKVLNCFRQTDLYGESTNPDLTNSICIW